MKLREEIFKEGQNITKWLKYLRPDHRDVLVAYYGLNGEKTMTQEQIAKKLKKSQTGVSFLKCQAEGCLIELINGQEVSSKYASAYSKEDLLLKTVGLENVDNLDEYLEKLKPTYAYYIRLKGGLVKRKDVSENILNAIDKLYNSQRVAAIECLKELVEGKEVSSKNQFVLKNAFYKRFNLNGTLKVSAEVNVLEYLPELNPRFELIIRKRFGLDGEKPMTQAEVANFLGTSMTKQNVSLIEIAALGCLKALIEKKEIPSEYLKAYKHADKVKLLKMIGLEDEGILDDLISKLSPYSKEIIERKFTIRENGEYPTLVELAKEMNITYQRIYDGYKKAIKELRFLVSELKQETQFKDPIFQECLSLLPDYLVDVVALRYGLRDGYIHGIKIIAKELNMSEEVAAKRVKMGEIIYNQSLQMLNAYCEDLVNIKEESSQTLNREK